MLISRHGPVQNVLVKLSYILWVFKLRGVIIQIYDLNVNVGHSTAGIDEA